MGQSIALAAVPIHVPWQFNLIIYGGSAIIAIAAIIAAFARALTSDRHERGKFFVKRTGLLTAAELNFLKYLERTVSSRWQIAYKVNMRDLIDIRGNDSKSFGMGNKINQKHVDFVLCSISTTEPLLVIELDDRSHNTLQRQEKDRFKDSCFQDAGLPVMRVTCRASYDVRRLSEEIERLIEEC